MSARYNPNDNGNLFNEQADSDFTNITDDERREAQQRLAILADDAREDLE